LHADENIKTSKISGSANLCIPTYSTHKRLAKDLKGGSRKGLVGQELQERSF